MVRGIRGNLAPASLKPPVVNTACRNADTGIRGIAVVRLRTGRQECATNPDRVPDRLKAVRDIRQSDNSKILFRRERGIGKSADLSRAPHGLAGLSGAGLHHCPRHVPPCRNASKGPCRRAARRGARPQPPRLRLSPRPSRERRWCDDSAPSGGRGDSPAHTIIGVSHRGVYAKETLRDHPHFGLVRAVR